MNEDLITASVVKRLLEESSARCSPATQKRLDESIAQAVRLHKTRFNPNTPKGKGSAWIESLSRWFNQPALSIAVSAVFVIGALAGIVQFDESHTSAKVTELADLDAAILSDDLPPDAYLDSGFVHYTSEMRQAGPLQSEEAIDQWLDSIVVDTQPST